MGLKIGRGYQGIFKKQLDNIFIYLSSGSFFFLGLTFKLIEMIFFL